MAEYRINIAGLIAYLDTKTTNLLLIPPHCYGEFFQPVAHPQAGLHLGKETTLSLTFQGVPFSIDASETLIYQSETWQYLKRDDGRLVFAAPDEKPPYKIVVAPDFKQGEVIGDFSQLAGKPAYPLQNMEIRLFAAWLANLGDILLHASGVIMNGKGYCFTGDSGAGKSTLASLLVINPSVKVLGEDQIILRFIEDRFWIFGTPWHLDPGRCSSQGAPLEKLFFLDRNASPGAELVRPAEAVSRLLQTAFIPYYLNEYLPGILDRLVLLTEKFPFHTLNYKFGVDDPLPLILKNLPG